MSTFKNNLCTLLCMCPLLLPIPAKADIERLAALIIRFSQYSELPAQTDRLQLCVLQDQRIIPPLNRLLPDFYEFEPEVLVLATPADAKQCHVVWTSFPYWPSNDWLNLINNQPLLWISDHPDLFRRGVLISVHYTPQAMRFRVNQSEAQKHQIRFNSRLLQLAHEII